MGLMINESVYPRMDWVTWRVGWLERRVRRVRKGEKIDAFWAFGRQRNELWPTRGEHSQEANALQGVENGWAE